MVSIMERFVIIHSSLWWEMALVQTCGLLVTSPIFTIMCPMLMTLPLLISSMKQNVPVTSLNMVTCRVILFTSCIPRFNKVLNSQNRSHCLVTLFLLDSVQKIQAIIIWYSTQLLYISPHSFMWYRMITLSRSSLFLPGNKPLFSGINFISMVISTLWLLMVIIRLI